MKPKFRIGDRVKTNRGEDFVVIDIGDSWREDDPFTYLLAGEMGRYDNEYSVWYPAESMELVGCGIPAPALRWEKNGEFTTARIFWVEFRIRPLRNGTKYVIAGEFYNVDCSTLEEAKEACQAYWQELWDKEMLLSRENH